MKFSEKITRAILIGLVACVVAAFAPVPIVQGDPESAVYVLGVFLAGEIAACTYLILKKDTKDSGKDSDKDNKNSGKNSD